MTVLYCRSLTSVGSQRASKKAGSSRRQCCDYIYTHAAAQLLSGSHLQTAGEQGGFQRGRFSHDIYFRFLWDDLSIHFFLKKGKERKKEKEGGREKQSGWIHLPADHITLCYFLLYHPTRLSLWPGLGHGHSTGLHKVTGERLCPHPWSCFIASSVTKGSKQTQDNHAYSKSPTSTHSTIQNAP